MGGLPTHEGLIMKRIFIALLIGVTGCTVTDQRADVYINPELSDRPTKFVVFNAGLYEGELMLALAKSGFQVKPIAIQGIVTEQETPNKIVEYKKAGYRFGIKLAVVDDFRNKCVFSGSHVLNVTMSVIDISTDDTIAIIRQVGPNGDCPPLTPVWTLLAQDLANTWKPPQPTQPPTN